MERKCPKCGVWNNDEDYCKDCGTLISPSKIAVKEEEERKAKFQMRKPGKLDEWFEKFAASKNPFVKILYYILYSIWFIFAALIGFALYIAAASPG